jgi:hypothetical protein
MERALSTLTQLPTTATQIKSYTTALKDDILSGYIPGEESAIILKSFEEILKALKSDPEIKKYLQNECEKYTEKTIDYKGAKITKSQRKVFDYSSDDEWSELKEQEKDVKAYIKSREEILKRGDFPCKTTDFLTIKLEK